MSNITDFFVLCLLSSSESLVDAVESVDIDASGLISSSKAGLLSSNRVTSVAFWVIVVS